MRASMGVLRIVLLVIWVVVGVLPVVAQTTPVPPVTDDDVNAVARRLFCPVCESEPLHTCLAPTCFEWRAEIRRQLEAGRTEAQIVAYFVAEGGQQVVGIPQDDGLRLLAIGGPVVGVLLAAWLGFVTIRRWRATPPTDVSNVDVAAPDDDYRARLEDDLRT